MVTQINTVYRETDRDLEIQDAYASGFWRAVYMMEQPPHMVEEWRKLWDALMTEYQKRHPEEFE